LERFAASANGGRQSAPVIVGEVGAGKIVGKFMAIAFGPARRNQVSAGNPFLDDGKGFLTRENPAQESRKILSRFIGFHCLHVSSIAERNTHFNPEPDKTRFGSFYGRAYGGGQGGGGTVFRLTIVPEFQAVTLTNSTLSLTWSMEAGGTYQLQYISNLSLSNWTSLGSPFTATGATLSTTDSVTNGSQRFYRLVVSP
jgi:hypothetical protein